VLSVHCGSLRRRIKSKSSISDPGSGQYSCVGDLNSCDATMCGNL